jgi:peptidoglycan hydrolase-like protein with peptidoglycan-binding domain
MIPVKRNNRADRSAVALLALPLVALLASSCSSGPGSTAAAEEPPPTLSVSPLPSTSVTLPPEPATTVAEATTTEEPTTTEATTTTVEETTTTTPPTTLPRNVEVVGPSAVQIDAVGTRDGDSTKAVQDRLLELGFWHAGSDGKYGHTTKQAVMAFQKYLGLEATGSVDETTAAYLANFDQRAHGSANTGDLIEVDKTKQLLFIVRNGMTIWTLNTSTATGLPYEEPDKNTPGEIQTGVSITPNGLWEVDRERPEGWWEGDLGEIYRPKYFRGGVAVHGSNSIPNYPASHGCVRVSVPAMDFIWDQNLMPMGITVWVHGD